MITLSTLIATIAIVLLAWAMEGKTRRPLLALPALAALAVGLGIRVFSGAGFAVVAGGLFVDLGIGLVAGGGYLAIRDANAKRFLVPGALSLIIGGLTLGPSYILRNLSFGSEPAGAGNILTFVAKPADVDRVPGQFLLELGPDDSIDEVAWVLEFFEASYERAFPLMTLADDEDLAQYYIIGADELDLPVIRERLAADTENVDFTEWNIRVEAVPAVPVEITPAAVSRFANDPKADRQWGLTTTRADALHEILSSATPRRQAIVAIVDTGVDHKHEDLRASFDDSPGIGDKNGHGTHCAGIAGAATNNGVGIASFNWDSKFVKVRSYKALGDNGGGSAETVAQAIIDAARDGADVISLSLGSFSPNAPRVEVQAVEFAQSKGAIVVAAAGNANADAAKHSPANIEGVIAVAAVDENNRKAAFSNTNTSLARPIAAPGVGILSLKPGDNYVALNGTSMAAPFVAGLLGVMRSLNPDLSPDDAYRILSQSAHDGPSSSLVGSTIDAAAAVEAVATSLAARSD